MRLRELIINLYRKSATSIPSDIEDALSTAFNKEKGISKKAIKIILENINSSRVKQKPICQDTGVPIIFVKNQHCLSQAYIEKEIISATKIATKAIPLRPNAVDIISGINSGDNTGNGFPIIYFEETKSKELIIDLILKGAGSENVSQLYKLPDEKLNAERDFEGVERCILDSIFKAQGKGCPPYIIAVGIGATKDQVTKLSKEQLKRRLDDTNKDPLLNNMENRILEKINTLGIGPLGLGGKTTAFSVKIGLNHRHPASYFVDVSIACWAHRRASLICRFKDEEKVEISSFKIIN